MDRRLQPAEKAFFVGKCETCRHSVGLSWTDAHIGCTLNGDASGEPSMTHRNWSCAQYDYEPGTLA